MQNKIYLFLENVKEEGILFAKYDASLVESLNYKIQYKRDNMGTPFGAPMADLITLTIRGYNDKNINTLYRRIRDNSPDSFTLVHNPVFDTNSELLQSYDNAIVYRGYIVDIEEYFHGGLTPTKNELDEQMLFTIKIMPTKVEYVGYNSDVTIHISE